MDIRYHFGQPTAPGESAKIEEITIALDPADDPDGHIAGLLMRERLEAFLTAYANPAAYGNSQDAEDARTLLLRFAFVAQMCASRLEGMQLAARDQWHMSWGTIANAVESSRSTVKGRISAARTRYAESGAWYEADGLHRGTPGQAAAAALRNATMDGTE